MANGLKRFEEIVNFLDKDTVSPEEIAEIFDVVFRYIKKNQDEIEDLKVSVSESLDKEVNNLWSLTNSSLQTVQNKVDNLETSLLDRIETIQLTPGPKGDQGIQGIEGKQGKAGNDGKNGSPDTSDNIRNKLELLSGEDRLDKSAIRGLEIFATKKELEALRGSTGGTKVITSGGNLEVFKSGIKVGSGTALNFTGSGISSITNDGHTTTINISGGGGGSWGSITGTLSDQTDLQTALDAKQPLDTQLTALAGLAYGSNAGKFIRVNATEDGFELVSNGAGDVTKVGTPSDNQLPVWTGDGTIEGTSDVTYNGTSFNIITGKNFQIAGATILSDSAGTTTLSNIDAIDATTEATIEAAIDTLANLTSIQGRTVTLADAGSNAFFGWDDTAGAYENLTQAEARTILGLGTAAYVATDLSDLNEATIEAAIDTLANLTSVQGLTIALADAGADALFGWDDSAGQYANLSASDARTALGLATGDSPQFTALNIGHASDTTVTRVGAGDIAVEGNTIYRAGGTDVALADGGTGASLADPNADRIMFWDDSAGAITWLTVGSGLAINDTEITATAGGIGGSAGSTDNALIRADGVGGSTIQSSTATLSDTGDLTIYDATNDGNPVFAFGAAAAERMTITPTFDGGAQTLNYIKFATDVASATADKGLFRFNVDGTDILDIDDGGINFAASKGISIAGTDIITDSSGTATLSNIDALDATTEATIEAAIDTLANLTSIQGRTVTLADAGANAIFGWDDTAGAYENLTQAEASAIIDHDQTANFVADEHVAHSGVTLTAGDGLTGGGDISANRTFAVGAGTGITVNANDVAVNQGTAFAWTAAHTHSVAGLVKTLTNTSDAASVQVAIFQGDRATMADNDEAYISLQLSDDGGTQKEVSRLTWVASDVNAATNVDGQLEIDVMVAGSLTNKLILSGTVLNLAASHALQFGGVSIISDSSGTTTLANIDAIDATTEATIEAAIDTLANLTSVQGLTVTLADAGADALFGWDDSAAAYINLSAADARAALGLATTDSPQFTAINLGHASDTTLTRVSAGVMAIEGVNVLTVAGGTLTGSITLGENTGIALDPAGSADGKWSGITIAGTSGYTQAFGDVVYLDPTDSRWEACDANAASGADGDCRGIIGIVVSAGTDGNACTILLQGQIRADANFPAMTINAPMYISETAGDITGTKPTTTDAVVRVVGFAITADEIYFNPSPNYATVV